MPQPPSQTDPASPPADTPDGFVGHARTVFLLTLASRILGLVRDAVCSRTFGTSPVFSAFVTAFTIPNLFRRLFGEGALSAAFIPVYAQLDEKDPETAARFASLTVLATLVGLSTLVLLGEVLLWLALPAPGAPDRAAYVYAMVMLPYMPLVCLVAILGGMLQTHGSFVPHAAAPVLLNLAMIGAVAAGAWILGRPLPEVALWMSGAVVAAGFVQLAWSIWRLRRHVRWGLDFAGCGRSMRSMLWRMMPALIGLGTLQLSTFLDSLIAGWPVIAGNGHGARVPFTEMAYPLDEQAAAVLFFAQRLYQFPLGVFGIAIATAVFPFLARAADRAEAFAATLRRGIRLSLYIGVPASVGLVLVREELTAAVYFGGEFDEASVRRVTLVLMAYAPAVWAYSLTHVLTRAFYARGETGLPMRVGMATVGLNLGLNLVLIWPLREAGLAVATAIGAVFQAGVLAWLSTRRLAAGDSGMIFDAPTRRSIGRTILMSAAMALAVWITGEAWTWLTGPATRWWEVATSLALQVGVGGVVYLGAGVALGREEVRWLFERAGKPSRQQQG